MKRKPSIISESRTKPKRAQATLASIFGKDVIGRDVMYAEFTVGRVTVKFDAMSGEVVVEEAPKGVMYYDSPLPPLPSQMHAPQPNRVVFHA